MYTLVSGILGPRVYPGPGMPGTGPRVLISMVLATPGDQVYAMLLLPLSDLFSDTETKQKVWSNWVRVASGQHPVGSARPLNERFPTRTREQADGTLIGLTCSR